MRKMIGFSLKYNPLKANSSYPTTDDSNHKYKVDNGLLKYKSRMVLSPTSSWKAKIMNELHATPAVGHNGVLKTY